MSRRHRNDGDDDQEAHVVHGRKPSGEKLDEEEDKNVHKEDL